MKVRDVEECQGASKQVTLSKFGQGFGFFCTGEAYNWVTWRQ